MSSLLPLSATLILAVALRPWLRWADFLHPATVRRDRFGAVSRTATVSSLVMLAGTTRPPGESAPRYSPPDSRTRGRDPLRHHRAVVGRDAQIPWYARVRALMALVVIVGVLGAGIAGFTLLLIASGRILLEVLAG